MAQGKAHSAEVTAAITAALLSGQGVGEVAEKYNLPKSTVSRLKARISESDLEQLGTKKGEQIEELVFGYLSANFVALTAQSRVAADEQYLKKFPPQQLAILHGVMADKAVRILEAISLPASEPETVETVD